MTKPLTFADIPADVTSISAETYKQIAGNATSANDLAPHSRPHSSVVNTESAGKQRFEAWLRATSPLPVVAECRFHDVRRWRLDWFVGGDKDGNGNIGFEWDGFGDHATVKGMLRDSEKLNEAALVGILVIRVNAQSEKDGSAYEMATRAFRVRGLEVLSGR